jgi:hypothetical protein
MRCIEDWVVQLVQVGVTAMLIASKYEEIWAPELNDFVYISDRAYKKEQILTMEKVMLNALKFNLTGLFPPLAFSNPACRHDCSQGQRAAFLSAGGLPHMQFAFVACICVHHLAA